MAGTITETARQIITVGNGIGQVQVGEVVEVDWTGDASDGTVPAIDLLLLGYVYKVITNPGTTAPTDNYDIVLNDPEDSSLDVLAGLLTDRDTATTEQVYPLVGSGRVLCNGTYSLAITGNSVNGAQGRVLLYVVN